jgi:hypothetical protein
MQSGVTVNALRAEIHRARATARVHAPARDRPSSLFGFESKDVRGRPFLAVLWIVAELAALVTPDGD